MERQGEGERAVTVKVGPIVYQLEETEGLVSGGIRLFGEVKHSNCVIKIEAGNGPQAKRQTLWHEIVHLVLSQAGRAKESSNEDLVDGLAYGIMGVVQDNPWLAEPVGVGGEDGGENAG